MDIRESCLPKTNDDKKSRTSFKGKIFPKEQTDTRKRFLEKEQKERKKARNEPEADEGKGFKAKGQHPHF